MNITWILTPELEDIDLDNMISYSCYDDKCLISSYWIDDILDFLNTLEIKEIHYKEPIYNDKYQYKIKFIIEESRLEEIKDKLIEFKTGRFRTTSIYRFDVKEEQWVKVWKRCARMKKFG
jgi:hypothetical protein